MVVQEKTIQLVNISAKLRKLWDEEQGKDRIRASLFNLIIFSKKGAKDQIYEKLIQSVISKFPCRVIWIKESIENDSLDVKVKGAPVSSNIFCEIIEIEVSRSYQERVASLVLPHIIPDLPFYLLWTEDPSRKESIFSSLAPLAKKIIFDTSYIENLHDFYRTTLQLSTQYPGVICDLNWSYIKGWRRLFAAVFDTKEALAPLMNAEVVRITYHAQATQDMKHNEIRAAYFQGWLASAFQWKFQNFQKEEHVFRLLYRHPLHNVSVFLIPKIGADCALLPPGALLSCEIESADAHYSFKRKPDSRQVFWQYSDSSRCDLPYCYYLSGVAEGQEILEEIFYHSEERHYRNTLELVSQIPWSQK